MIKEHSKDKTIAILCPGPSLKQFKKWKKKFEVFDWYWVGINRYWFLEEIHKIDLILAFCNVIYGKEPERFQTSKPIIWRNDINHLNDIKGNALYFFLLQCLKEKIKRIVIFGADGGFKKDKLYFTDECKERNDSRKEYPELVKYFNKNFPKEYNTEIINVSLKSNYECFPKMSYENFYKYMIIKETCPDTF